MTPDEGSGHASPAPEYFDLLSKTFLVQQSFCSCCSPCSLMVYCRRVNTQHLKHYVKESIINVNL